MHLKYLGIMHSVASELPAQHTPVPPGVTRKLGCSIGHKDIFLSFVAFVLLGFSELELRVRFATAWNCLLKLRFPTVKLVETGRRPPVPGTVFRSPMSRTEAIEAKFRVRSEGRRRR